MTFVRISGDNGALLEAFRKQVRTAIELRGPEGAWAVMLMWDGERGTTRDDLIDAVNEELGLKPPAPARARPGGVQPSPFA